MELEVKIKYEIEYSHSIFGNFYFCIISNTISYKLQPFVIYVASVCVGAGSTFSMLINQPFMPISYF